MRRNVANHLHRYKRVNLSGDKRKPYFVYRCMRPACSHYIPMHLLLGKVCECNVCHEPMIITREIMVSSGGGPPAKPRCEKCIKRKIPETVNALADFVSAKEKATKRKIEETMEFLPEVVEEKE